MLILASQSPSRAKILREAGVQFETIPAFIDEDSIKQALLFEKSKPRDIADALGEAKARKMSMKYLDALVLSSDQIVSLGGEIFSKPKSRDDLRNQLLSLRGKKHLIHTSAVIALGGAPIWRFVAEVQIQMRAFSDQFLEEYVDKEYEHVRSCAGGYQIEGVGAQLIEEYRGDYFSILGLPLFSILGFLRERGELSK